MKRRFKPGDRVRVVGGRHDCATGKIVSYGSVDRVILDTTHAMYEFAPASDGPLSSMEWRRGIVLLVEHVDDIAWSPYQ